MVDERVLLLSVKPRFADAILSRQKTVELRRTRVTAPVGSQVLLYSSSPIKCVVGTAMVSAIEERTPGDLWHRTHGRIAVDRGEFDEYFAGAARSFALHLSNATALPTPITLSELRSRVGVEPPQSFRYLTRSQADALTGASRGTAASTGSSEHVEQHRLRRLGPQIRALTLRVTARATAPARSAAALLRVR
jgi:predicted transcriptional regulator